MNKKAHFKSPRKLFTITTELLGGPSYTGLQNIRREMDLLLKKRKQKIKSNIMADLSSLMNPGYINE